MTLNISFSPGDQDTLCDIYIENFSQNPLSIPHEYATKIEIPKKVISSNTLFNLTLSC